METNYEKMINDMLHHLVERFNAYSSLVEINRHCKHSDGTLQWNRGSECTYEEEARDLAEKLGRKVEYEMRKDTILAETPDEYEIEYRAMKVAY